jgi:hypothetical protein
LPPETLAALQAATAGAAISLPAGTLGIVGGSFRQSHRLIKKPLLQIAHHRLRVRVSNVGMAVVNEINRFEHMGSFSFYRHGPVQAKDTE